MNEQFGSVYAIRCTKNGKIYIGSTVQLKERIYQHFQELKAGKKTKISNVNKIKSYDSWQSDYDKYGKDAFEVYCIEEKIPKNKLHERESHWITVYQARDPEFGYNARGLIREIPTIIVGLPPKRKEGSE